MALESREFCNNYLRAIPSDEGLVTLSGIFNLIWKLSVSKSVND